ncbi:MAG: hypothetical protein GY789_26180 [Hyphomicrobiales bacterium]|nr:hypothetical protein [Hyphomicrobiales bacterium]
MKKATLFACIIVGFVVGGTSAMAKEITTEKQFLEQIAGRNLAETDSWVIISPDGTVSGKGPNNGKIVGKWIWEGRYYCRDIVIDGVPLPRDCQTVSIKGDTVAFTHNKGDGISIVWAIQ